MGVFYLNHCVFDAWEGVGYDEHEPGDLPNPNTKNLRGWER